MAHIPALRLQDYPALLLPAGRAAPGMLGQLRKSLPGGFGGRAEGSAKGHMRQLWGEGAAGTRDFLLSDLDVSELLAAFVHNFPAGASKEVVGQALGGSLEDAHALLLVLCRYLTRQISNESDAYVVRLFSRDEPATSQNCRIISRVIIPALKTSDDLLPVCEAGVPSRVVKLLLRLQTMAVLLESGRSSDRTSDDQLEELKQDELNGALNVIVRILRHVCGGVSMDDQQPGNFGNINICAVEDLISGDAVRALIDLAGQAVKPYSSGLSRWIEVHAVDVLLTILRHGMSPLLAGHLIRNDMLQPVVEALAACLDARDTPNLLGVIGLFKVLLQSSVAACNVQQYELVEYVRSLHLGATAGSASSETHKSLLSDMQGVPLMFSLLKHIIVKLSTMLYIQGAFSGEDERRGLQEVTWNQSPNRTSLSNKPGPSRRSGDAGRARGPRGWGETTQDGEQDSLEQVREFKARRLAYELLCVSGIQLTRGQALRLLQDSAWDIEQAQRLGSELGAKGISSEISRDQAPKGGLGMRLEIPPDTPADRPPRYFVVSKVLEHGAAYRSGAVHIGDRLLKVDGVPTSKMTLDALAARLKGPIGSQVTLVLQAQPRDEQHGARVPVRLATLLRSAMSERPVAAPANTNLSDQERYKRIDKVVERLEGAVTRESAQQVLEKCSWDLKRATKSARVLPHRQAMAHLLDIARELVFVGKDAAEVNQADETFEQKTQTNTSKAAFDNTGATGHAQQGDRAQGLGQPGEEMGNVAGRRVRNVLAFDLLSELWQECPDDELRLQLLDMALVIFAEHPLNFFALQESSLLGSAMDSLEYLSNAVRDKVLRVLEYVLTVEQCLPLQHLCRLTRNLDTQWRQASASLVLSNVIKWIQFDAKLVAVLRETGLLHVLLRHCRMFSKLQISQATAQDRHVKRDHMVSEEAELDPWMGILESAELVAPDGTVSYQALMSHIRDTVELGSVSPDLQDLGEEEESVLFDRIWAAINSDYVLKMVPIEWRAGANEVVSFLHLINDGHTANMRAVEPSAIGETALAIVRAYVSVLREKLEQSDNQGLNGVADRAQHASEGARHELAGAQDRHDASESECLICARTFPVVVDTILAFISQNVESVDVAREEGLAAAMVQLVPIVEWRDGAFSIIERIVLEDPYLRCNELSGLLELVAVADPRDLELRSDIIQTILKLAYAHPGVRSEVRFGWMLQAVKMIEELSEASNSTWGEKLKLAEMLVTFICLAMASSETNRTGFWAELGPAGLAQAFQNSTLMDVGKGLTVIGMLLSIAISRDVVPEAMLHGADKGSPGSKDMAQRQWQGIGLSHSASVETAVFINRWGDHKGGEGAVMGKVAGRLRNPDAAVMTLPLLSLVHRDARKHAARAILRLARLSGHNCRALTEAGFVSVLLDQCSDALLAPNDKILQPILGELLVHFARHRLSIKDLYSLFGKLTPPTAKPPHLLQALGILQQACPGPGLSSSTNTTHPYFEAAVNCQHETSPGAKCPAMLDIHGLEGVCWPPNTGLTFCCWLRVDKALSEGRPAASSASSTSFKDAPVGKTLLVKDASMGGTKPTALIFSLRAQEQAEESLRAVLNNGVLTVESPGRFATSFEFLFEFGNLYHVALVYHRHRLLGADSLTLFVDGVEAGEHRVAFDKNIKDFKTSSGIVKQRFNLHLGGDVPGKGAATPAAAASWIQPAIMRLGDACLLDEAVSPTYINGLFLLGGKQFAQIGSELGPMLANDILSYDVLTRFDKTLLAPGASQSSFCSLSTGTVPVASVKFSCSAAAVCSYKEVLPFSAAIEPDSGVVRHLSRLFGSDAGGGTSELRLHESVQCVHPLAFADALRSVGSVQMLLDLVARAATTQALNKALSLFVSCVRLNAFNLNKLAACQGYSLLALFLQRKVNLLDMLSIQALFDLVGLNGSSPQTGALSNETALRDLLFANHLWQLLESKMRVDVYELQAQTICCKYDPLSQARLAQVGAMAGWLDVLTQETCPLPPPGVEHVVAMISFMVRFHLSIADLKRVVVTVLATLPVATSDSKEIEDASRRVHVRNLLLNVLLEQLRYFTQNADDRACSDIHRVVNPRFLLHVLSRRPHSSTMTLVLRLLTLHVIAKPKYAKRFMDAGGVQELKDIMPAYCACPHAYLLMFHSLLVSPITVMPEILDVESFVLYVEQLESLAAMFPEAFAVVGAMLEEASSTCAHVAVPPKTWSGTCTIRTSIEGEQAARASLVQDSEMPAFLSEVLKCIKTLFERNTSFRVRSLNDAMLVSNILSVVLPPVVDSKQPPRLASSHHNEIHDSPPPQPVLDQLQLSDISSAEDDDDIYNARGERHMVAGGHPAGANEADNPDMSLNNDGAALGNGTGGVAHGNEIRGDDSLEELSVEEYAVLQQQLALASSWQTSSEENGVSREAESQRAASLGASQVLSCICGSLACLQSPCSCAHHGDESCHYSWHHYLPSIFTRALPCPMSASAPQSGTLCVFPAYDRRVSDTGGTVQPEGGGAAAGEQRPANRRTTLDGFVGSTGEALKGVGTLALLPVKGAVMGVGVLGHGAMAGASALGKGVKFELPFSSAAPAKGYNMDNFVLVSMDEYAKAPGLRDGAPPSESSSDARPLAHDSSFVEVGLESSAGASNGAAAQGPTSGDASMILGLHVPRAPNNILTELDWCLSSQTMELLCLAVLDSTKLQARGHALLRKTLDGSVPLQVPDSLLAVYQTRMLLSIVRFLMTETDRELVTGNTKLAINMCKLAGYAVDKMYTGWLITGHQDVLKYCVHVLSMVENHSVYWNLYRGVAASVWRAALYVVTVGKGETLSNALQYMSEHSNVVFNSTGMDAAMCSQAFKALTDILLTLGQSHKDYTTLVQRAGRVAGELLSVNSPHTRQVIMGMLVYKPSITAKLFRKGEKDKAIDLMRNGFDKLCGAESVSTLNPLRTWWKPGDHLSEFRAWALEPQTRPVIIERLAQSLVTSSKELGERCARLSREDLCPFAVRWNNDRAQTRRELLQKRRLLTSILKRTEAFSLDLDSFRRERRLDAHRRVMRQRVAQFWWLVSRRLLEGPAGVWQPQPQTSAVEKRGQWMIDSFQDALHTRRRRVPATFICSPPRDGCNQWLAQSRPAEDVSDLALAVSLPGVAIKRDWNDASSDDEDENAGAQSAEEQVKDELRAKRAQLEKQKAELEAKLVEQQSPKADRDADEGAGVEDTAGEAHAKPPENVPEPVTPKKSLFGLGRFTGRMKRGSETPKTSTPVSGAALVDSESRQSMEGDGNGQLSTLHGRGDGELGGPEAGEGGEQVAEGEGDLEQRDSYASSNSDADASDAEQDVSNEDVDMAGGQDHYRFAAFVADTEAVAKTYKASRVEGLNCIPGTLTLCRFKAGDSRIRVVYFIEDSALDVVHSVLHDGEVIEMATGDCHDISFCHINQVAPGVMKWEDDKTRSVQRRSWLQQPLALEFCDVRGASTLLVLPDSEARNDFVADLSSQTQRLMAASGLEMPSSLSGASRTGWRLETRKTLSDARKSLVKKWSSGLISNFEYLMELNLMAGRSTNDLSRYPVFPWVLADYTSEVLDLNDPATFRDLSKPMGCQHPQRREAFEERYREWDDQDTECPAFHYGTHYSTSAHVLHYLVRMQPYTSMHMSLQSGRFDQPDRLFHSLQESWQSTSGNENMSEVKELIPEMFYQADMFLNESRLDLGERQDGQRVDHVVLPPWAHGDACEFVRLHRAALESVHVSANLHKWIDLVFGYKQRGKFAVEAVNVFHYLTYEGAIDITAITDDTQKQAVLSQISHFGQCPKQMFQRPHPARVTTPGYSAICNPELLHPIQVDVGMMVGDVLTQQDKVLAIGYGSILVKPSGELCLIPDVRHPGAVSVVVTETKKTVGMLQGMHQGLVTALAVAGDASVLASGGQDGVVRLWDISAEAWWTCPPKVLGTNGDALVGHHSAVKTLALSKSQGIGVSGAEDGSAIIWDLSRCTSVQLLKGHQDEVVGVAIDDENGSIISCSSSRIQAWTVNGQQLASVRRHDSQAFKVEVKSCAARNSSVWTPETIFLTGHADGHIAFWKLIPRSRAARESAFPRNIAVQTSNDHACPCVLAPMWTLAGAGEAATVLRFGAASRELVSGHERGKVNVWRISEHGCPKFCSHSQAQARTHAGMMSEVQMLMEQDSLVLAFSEGLAEAAGLPRSARTKCLSRQAALDVVRTAGNPCSPLFSSEVSPRAGDTGARGVYAALAMHGYLERANLALTRIDSAGDLSYQWQDWLSQFAGSWTQFWSAAEAFLHARVPSLAESWLQDSVTQS